MMIKKIIIYIGLFLLIIAGIIVIGLIVYSNKASISKIINSPDMHSHDSLLFYLRNYDTNKLKYREENSLEYLQNEYNINRLYMKIVEDSNIISYDTVLHNITMKNYELNELIERYNDDVKSYNKYLTLFPNLIVAKRNNFERKMLYSIKYGDLNEDPVLQHKGLPEWAKDIDTMRLYTQ